jgi:rRNA-processing protein EBP2
LLTNSPTERKADSSAPTDDTGDLFDVAIDDANQTESRKRGRTGGDGASNFKRHKKDSKFGFGGKKRHAKSGDAQSTGDLRGYSQKKMKAGASKRPGKARRAAAKGRS